MITSIHTLIYSDDPAATRAFLRDVLGLSSVDAGDGWLIFALPPAELAAHPADQGGDAELYLMRLCSHAIMANSSYSWWGAWLGADMKGGIVVAPNSWFGPAAKYDPRDIVPARWIRL